MPTLDERIKKEQEKLEQLKRQKRARQQRDKKKERKTDTRRKILTGAILLDIFPQFQVLKPQKNNAENIIEFAPLANFLICLAEKKEWVAQLEKEAKKRGNEK